MELQDPKPEKTLNINGTYRVRPCHARKKLQGDSLPFPISNRMSGSVRALTRSSQVSLVLIAHVVLSYQGASPT